MTLDIQALRAKFNELKGAAARTDVLWKPSEGDNLIRIVPLKDNPDFPFIELQFHSIGGKTLLSPLSFNERDPIAEFAESLKAEAGGKMPAEDWKEVKKYIPYTRTYVPVIDRNKPEVGVRFWAFGKTVYKELISILTDPDYGNITDPQTGRDIKVNYTPQEKSDTNFAKTTLRVSVKQTPLTSDAELLKKYLTEQPDLMSMWKRNSYDELKAVLKSHISGKPAENTPRTVVNTTDDEWGESVDESPSASKSNANKRKVGKDVVDEFEELFEK